jgi:pilus assembly protein Flp/PilA
LFPFTHRTLPLPEKRGQGLLEYALILSLVAIVVIVALALLGSSIETVYCKVVSQFPGNETTCAVDGVDVVEIITADYNPTDKKIHLDATSNGDYDPDVIFTASPGGVMGATAHHFHLNIEPIVCPCDVTVTSSLGGSDTVHIDPPPE